MNASSSEFSPTAEFMYTTSYKRYVLVLLTIVFTLNYLDRYLMILLLQPIKEDLHLSDTQLGFLTGIAFGLFYATLGVPIARWADRGNRAMITSLAIAMWGLTVMSCVLVRNFIQLVCARVFAAVGESGCMPPTYSLVGDYFPEPGERARAMGIYWLASPVAALVSFAVGGWLNELYGWRVTFFVMGAPALLIAALVKLTVGDPRTFQSDWGMPQQKIPPMGTVLRTLWDQRSSRHLGLAIILLWTMALGLAPWYAAFMMRTHGMRTGELGLWMGSITGVAGVCGTLLGGYLTGRWLSRNEKGQMRLSATMVGSLVPCFVLFLLLPEKHQALIVLAPLMVVFFIFVAPSFVLMQRLVSDDMRATSVAVVMLLANLIGMGLGPQVVGILSDLLTPRLGNDALRYAMLIVSLVALWSAYHFWQVGETVRDDLESIRLRKPERGVAIAHEVLGLNR